LTTSTGCKIDLDRWAFR